MRYIEGFNNYKHKCDKFEFFILKSKPRTVLRYIEGFNNYKHKCDKFEFFYLKWNRNILKSLIDEWPFRLRSDTISIPIENIILKSKPRTMLRYIEGFNNYKHKCDKFEFFSLEYSKITDWWVAF